MKLFDLSNSKRDNFKFYDDPKSNITQFPKKTIMESLPEERKTLGFYSKLAKSSPTIAKQSPTTSSLSSVDENKSPSPKISLSIRSGHTRIGLIPRRQSSLSDNATRSLSNVQHHSVMKHESSQSTKSNQIDTELRLSKYSHHNRSKSNSVTNTDSNDKMVDNQDDDGDDFYDDGDIIMNGFASPILKSAAPHSRTNTEVSPLARSKETFEHHLMPDNLLSTQPGVAVPVNPFGFLNSMEAMRSNESLVSKPLVIRRASNDVFKSKDSIGIPEEDGLLKDIELRGFIGVWNHPITR